MNLYTIENEIVAGKSYVIWDFNKLLLPRVMSILPMSNCQIKITRKYHVAFHTLRQHLYDANGNYS